MNEEEILNFYYDAGRQCIEIYPCIKFRLPHFLSVTCTIHAPFIMYCSRLFVVVFQEINCLQTFKHVYVRQVTELHLSIPSFMFVSAVVSEIHELNQNKKKKMKKNNSEICYFRFITFPGHIIYPFFNQRYFLSSLTHSIC